MSGPLVLIYHICGLQAGVINDLVLLSAVGIRPVLVHGGGPEINSWLEKLGIVAEFKNGLRVTDGACACNLFVILPCKKLSRSQVHFACLSSKRPCSQEDAVMVQAPRWMWWRWCWEVG